MSELTPQGSLNFVFCPHSASYAPSIAANVVEADIVAYEGFTQRIPAREINTALNQLSAGEDTECYWADNDGKNQNYWMFQVAEVLKGEGKQFVNIDASNEGELGDKFNQFVEIRGSVNDVLAHYGSPLAAADMLIRGDEVLGDLTNQRDKIMATNIDKVIAQNPNANLAVVVGSGHTNLARLVARSQVTRKTYMNFHPYARCKLELGAAYSLPRYFSFGIQPPERLAQRSILQHLVKVVMNKDEGSPEDYGVSRFSDEQVDRFIDQLERASKKIDKDPKAAFRYKNAVIQTGKLAAKILSQA